ncbi:MAG: hypothetical protein ABIN05_07860 [candidate division WOR-3 bacterium]
MKRINSVRRNKKKEEIIARAKKEAQMIIEEAKTGIEKKKEELLTKEKELEEKEKQINDKINQYKQQMQAGMNALHAKNMLLRKIKYIAFLNNRNPKNRIEEIKKKLHKSI